MNYEHLMTRVGGDAVRERAAVDRRSFLKLGAGSGFALGLFAWTSAGAADAPAADAALKPQQQPEAFVRIDRDGIVTVMVNRLDFGQGVLTGLPMLVAEEMDADWSKVRGELAPAGDAYKDPAFGIQMTGGSSATNHSWMQYRELGARTRAMLVAAAAQKFGVAPSACQVDNGVVSAGGKRAGFGELAAEAMKQPVPQKVALKEAKAFKRIGQRTGRLDAVAKSSGRQDFGIDARADGMKTVLVLHPPVFGAKVGSVDSTRAKAVKGVHDVIEVPLDRGATGLAVIADGYWPAKMGRDALQVQWKDGGVEKVDSDRLLAQYKTLATQPGIQVREADTSKIATAPKILTAEFSFPYLAHAPMEPLNCLIHFDGQSCEVSAGSQFQTIDQANIAATLGLKPEQVQLTTMMAGGGFGRRAVPTSDYLVEAAQIAKAWKASGKSGPLKIVWSREDDIRGGYYRPMHVHRAEIGFDGKGKVLGWKHTIVGQSILMGTPFEQFMVKNGVDSVSTEGVADTPYDLPLALQVHHPKVNVPVLWWRSVGHTHTAFVMETLVDEIARSTGQDPVAYRRALLGAKHTRHLAALDLAVQKSGYGKKALPAGRAYGVAVHESFGSVVAYVVEASLRDGQPVLHKVTAGVHCNTVVNPLAVEAQVQGAALMALGTTLPGSAITLKDGVVQQSNFGDYTVARMPQMPVIDVHTVPSTEPPTGMGEPGVPPLAPAFANAIAKLTGKPLRSLPFTVA
ncbi:xanthine dehydrogenase family protein molybdopterin-binding subunit [Piscinibacter sp.]|uniref:xanthine dehydrogenase family protein molybdopterin-binding subunit n=1 Tax=Piscinibacter sp. TaxID=1903157 RepID=UPI002C084832|nr:xanthine dehydrogenase family protein molybdopterin-binding subunit [Albitalea sp.]HUG21812.1 xanthine dehydrogenase family protein molybdopterin-binding subunit [Albitalea sp.]